MTELQKRLLTKESIKGAITHLEFRKAILAKELTKMGQRPEWFFTMVEKSTKQQKLAEVRHSLSNIQKQLFLLRSLLAKMPK